MHMQDGKRIGPCDSLVLDADHQIIGYQVSGRSLVASIIDVGHRQDQWFFDDGNHVAMQHGRHDQLWVDEETAPWRGRALTPAAVREKLAEDSVLFLVLVDCSHGSDGPEACVGFALR